MDALLRDIEAFLASSGMTQTAFGREALGDPGFIPDLREGRRVWPETEQKARAFIQANSAPQRSASDAPKSNEVAQ